MNLPKHSRPSMGLTKIGCAICFAATLMTGLTAPAASFADEVYKSGAERIDAADTIRGLSQQIAVAACLMDAGADPDTYGAQISEAVAEYDMLMNALNEGDQRVGIATGEEDRRMLFGLRGLSLQWDNYKTAIAGELAGDTTSESFDYIARHNLNVMHSGKYVVSEIINRYSIPPALLQVDAFTLNIVARQRSLSLRIAKEACGVITGSRTMGSALRLSRVVEQFELSHSALLDGFPSAGVSTPPTPEIAAGLAAITDSWTSVKAQVETVSASDDINTAVRIYEQLSAISGQYDALVAMYVEDSKAGI